MNPRRLSLATRRPQARLILMSAPPPDLEADRQLDEALELTFPASDPVALTVPSRRSGPDPAHRVALPVLLPLHRRSGR